MNNLNKKLHGQELLFDNITFTYQRRQNNNDDAKIVVLSYYSCLIQGTKVLQFVFSCQDSHRIQRNRDTIV